MFLGNFARENPRKIQGKKRFFHKSGSMTGLEFIENSATIVRIKSADALGMQALGNARHV